MTANEVLQLAQENGARQVDVRFADIPGLQHHISYPIGELTESAFTDGFGIDGSSIRGWAAINESDMLLIPDPSTAFMDPFMETPTLVMIGDVRDPLTRQNYERDPRWIARKAELYLQQRQVGRGRYGVYLFGAEGGVFYFPRQRSLRSERPTQAFISSTPRKAAGIRAARRTTSVTGRATKRAISPFLPPIITRICAPKW